MNVLVTGGAGFLGINLIRHLLDSGGRRITSFDIADFPFPEIRSIEAIRGDIRNRPAVRKALKGVDCVVHGASALPLYSREEIHSTVVGGTRILLEESERAGAERFIQISSTAVYGVPEGVPITEDAPLVGVGPYGQAKILAEELCRKAREADRFVCVIRPKSFVGPERLGVFELLYDWAAKGRSFPVIGRGDNRYQLLDVSDLCRFIEIALRGTEPELNDVFNIGAADYGSIREDFQSVLNAAGFGRRIVPLPAGPTRAALRLMEKLGLSPLYGWVYETAGKNSAVDIGKAVRQAGFRPRFSNSEALLRNFRWYMENRENLASSGTDHRSPWKRGFLALAERFF